MNIISSFEKEIKSTANLSARFLLAVSGGNDSTALFPLCVLCNLDFGVAHYNYQLRGQDSDDDAAFIQQLCEEADIAFHKVTYDTTQIAADKKISIQLAARELRYDFFKSTLKQGAYDYILTAHHLNDNIETILYQFTKGASINLLSGMPKFKNKILRPLLKISREQIETCMSTYGFDHREDSSNKSTKYARNHIRHNIVPALKSINPNLEQTILNNQYFWQANLALLDSTANNLLKKHLTIKDKIESLAYNNTEHLAVILHRWLQPKGFHIEQIKLIEQATRQQKTGVHFSTNKMELIVNRTEILVQELKAVDKAEFQSIHLADLQGGTTRSVGERQLSFTIKDRSTVKFSNDKNIALFDLDKVEFPIQVRYWKEGDKVQPFGLKGKKKLLSDIFINKKVNRFEKSTTPLLIDHGDNIIYVAGLEHCYYATIDKLSSKILEVRYL